MVDLDRIEALANAATPGPWTTAPDPGCGEVCDCGETCSREDHALIARSAAPTVGLAVVLAEERDEANAAFIAAAREDIPALVAELRAARADLTVAAADRDLYRDLYRQVYDAVAGESLGNLPTRDIVAAAVAHREAHAEIERLRTATADAHADVVAWLRGMGRGFASHLASEFEQGAHVGAANGGDHG